MDTTTTLILFFVFLLAMFGYSFVFTFKLKEILNFCTRPHWHPVLKLLVLNIFIFIISSPIFLLDSKNAAHHAFTIFSGGLILTNYSNLLFFKKEYLEPSENQNNQSSLPNLNRSAKNVYMYVKDLNRKIFNKDYLSHKDAFLVFICMFPYLDLFTKEPIYLASFYSACFIFLIANAFLIFQAAKISSPEDYK